MGIDNMDDNSKLRKEAANAIANYMHHELFEITGDTKILPWLSLQGESFMDMIDRAVINTKNHPMADEIRKMKK